MNDITTKLDEIDGLIRSARGEEARTRFLKLAPLAMPRRHAFRAAVLARRLNLNALAVRILNPVVRPAGTRRAAGLPAERAEYAIGLVRLGARAEAERLLESIDSDELPQALLYRAFARILQWDYAASVPLLEQYLAREQPAPYERLVAESNLAAALVVERRHAEADSLLRRLAGQTQAAGHRLLLGTVLELIAQSAILQRDWALASQALRRAGKLLERASETDRLLVVKWRAIAELARHGVRPETLARLRRVKSHAHRLGHWESVRDCDRALAFWAHDPEAAGRVFFGTPYPHYRSRLAEDLSGWWSPPASFRWRLRRGRGEVTLDAPSLSTLGRRSIALPIKVGQTMHRLLLALSGDFYRPRPLAALHAELYPNEWFHPESSADRAHRVIRRLRHELESAGSPLRIAESGGAYRLQADKPFSLQLSSGVEAGSDTRRDWLLRRLPRGPFSREEAQEALGLSPRTTQRLLATACDQRWLRRDGRGRATVFSLIASPG